jgi:WD40 repeat protein
MAEALKGEVPVISTDNASAAQHVANFIIEEGVEDVFWSTNGKTLIITNKQGEADFYSFSYESATLENSRILYNQDTYSFAISPDGKQIAKQNDKGQFEIYDIATNELVQTAGGEVASSQYVFIAWSPQMDVLATMYFIPPAWASFPEIRVYDVDTTERVENYASEDIPSAYGLVFSPGGSLIATTSSMTGDTYVWNRNTGAVGLQFFGEQPAFNPNGQWIAIRSVGSVTVHSTADGSTIVELEAPLREDVYQAETTFSPDSSLAVTTGANLSIWQMPEGNRIAHFGAEEPYTHAVFSPDGKLLVTIRREGDQSRVIIWAVLPK